MSETPLPAAYRAEFRHAPWARRPIRLRILEIQSWFTPDAPPSRARPRDAGRGGAP